MKNKCPLYHACREIKDCKKDYSKCMLLILTALEVYYHQERESYLPSDPDAVQVPLTQNGEIMPLQMETFNIIYKICEKKGWTKKVIRSIPMRKDIGAEYAKKRKRKKRNQKKTKEYYKKYYQEHKEQCRGYQREYRQKNRKQLKEYDRKYHQEHKEQRKEHGRRYREQQKLRT